MKHYIISGSQKMLDENGTAFDVRCNQCAGREARDIKINEGTECNGCGAIVVMRKNMNNDFFPYWKQITNLERMRKASES